MSKADYPITPAIRFLREHKIDFIAKVIDYVDHGGTAYTAEQLNVPEHQIIKTIVLHDEHKKGMIVLMHGDKEISTRNLARQLNKKHIELATPQQAQKWTGYLFGGTSPFGIKTQLPIYIEQTIWDLESIYINGGKRGFQVAITPNALNVLDPTNVNVATE